MEKEELQEMLVQEQERTKALQASYDALKLDTEKLGNDNKQLIDYNNKLFMRVSEPIEQKTKELSAEEKETQQLERLHNLMKDRRN